jgi:hypothetical protein
MQRLVLSTTTDWPTQKQTMSATAAQQESVPVAVATATAAASETAPSANRMDEPNRVAMNIRFTLHLYRQESGRYGKNEW